MKAIIKLLFAAALTFCAVTYLPQADALTQISGGLFYTILLVNLVVPVKQLHTGQLNAITDVVVFNKYIIEKLRKVNDFLFRSRDESRFVLGGATVYIPQAGNDPTVEVDTFTLPGVPAVRTDSDVNYTLNYFRTVPTVVPWAELQTISYNKIDSVIGAHMKVLAEKVANKMLINWCPAAVNQIITTGADVAPITGQVGNRKGFSHKDLQTAMIAMNVADVPKQGRVALIDDNMYGFFYDEMTDKQFNAFQQFANNETGLLGRLHGFDVYSRSSVLQFALAGTVPEALGAALDATDNLASLCWQEDMVAKAIGETKFFADKDRADYYGDIYSAIVRAGGRAVRSDKAGVYAIVQGQ